MRMRIAIILAIVVLGAAAAAYAPLSWAIEIHRQHMTPHDKIVRDGATEMTLRDFVLWELLPASEVGEFRHWLLRQPIAVLWALVYVVLALVGWSASVLLVAMQGGDAARRQKPFLALFAAVVAGLAAVLLIRLSFPDDGMLIERAAPPATPGYVPNAPSALGRWMLLPLLAGLFLTTFFEGLRGILVKILAGWPFKQTPGDSSATPAALLVALASVAVGMSSPAYAQETDLKTVRPKKYYVCTAPETVSCVAKTAEQKAGCPECRTWIEKTVTLRELLDALQDHTSGFASLASDPAVASRWAEVPPANFFADAVATEVWERALPETSFGFPVTIRELYDNPEEAGWIETSAETPGALVVWPSQAGVVVETTDEGETRIAYPSHALGEIAVRSADQLEVLGVPKYLIPESSPE